MGRTRVRLRVRESLSLHSAHRHGPHPTPLTVSLDPQSKANALLLTTNTEVTIAPKPHLPNSKSLSATSTSPTADPTSGSTTLEHPTQTLRVLHPRIFHAMAPTHSEPKLPNTGTHLLAYVSHATFALLTKSLLVAIPPLTSTTTFHKCTLRRLLPPIDPSDSPPVSKPHISAPLSHIFHPGEGERFSHKDTGEKDENDTGHANELYIAWRPGVPNYHVVLEDAFPSVDGVEEWDLAVSVH